MTRVAAYVDGFNLYFGMKAKYQRKYLWLDLQALAISLLRADQTLSSVNYFTARVRNDPESEARQSDYLDALATHCTLLHIVNGRFQDKSRRCRGCGETWSVQEEKETDVNIASALIEDAAQDRYDTALIISGDSDLCPAIRAMKRLCPGKRALAAFPPRRQSAELKNTVDGFLSIGGDKIRHAQLPESVLTASGVSLSRPSHWS